MTTHEKNIIIAKFMGGKLHDHPELNGAKVWTGYEPINNKLNLPNNIRFDNDWNLLMDVAKKIEILSYSDETVSSYFEKNTYTHFVFGSLFVCGDIEGVYEDFLDFINKYQK